MAVLGLCSQVIAGQGEEFIEIDFEGGLVEISVTLDPPDGSPTSQSMQFAVKSNGMQNSFSYGDANAGGEGIIDLSAFDGKGFSSLQACVNMNAGQSGFGYVVTVRMRTIEPIILRLLDEVEFSDFSGGDFTVSLSPQTGMISGNVICPGTYALELDGVLVLGVSENSADSFSEYSLQLTDTLGPDVRFTGPGDITITGVSTSDQGVEDTALVEASVENGNSFAAAGCTSSGLVEGDAETMGDISNQSNGAYNLTVMAEAIATQPAGYAGSCFIGTIGENIIVELTKPKVFTIVGSGNGSISLTPTTGSINGATLSAGLYSLNFNASATIDPGETNESRSITWTIELRPPGCNAADVAPPIGSLDFSDVIAFLAAYGSSEAAADLAPPIGVWDFSDVIAFLGAFGAGCP